MSLYLLLLCLLFTGTGGIAIGGAIMSLIGWILLGTLLVLIWEYKLYIFLFITSVVIIMFITRIFSDYMKYKDETPEQREERLKTNKMIEEWRKRNGF